MRATAGWEALPSVNHNVELGPFVISCGSESARGRLRSLIAPAVVTRPMAPGGVADDCGEFVSVNQRAPSGPVTIAPGVAFGVGRSKKVRPPDVVLRPIRAELSSVNQRAVGTRCDAERIEVPGRQRELDDRSARIRGERIEMRDRGISELNGEPDQAHQVRGSDRRGRSRVPAETFGSSPPGSGQAGRCARSLRCHLRAPRRTTACRPGRR